MADTYTPSWSDGAMVDYALFVQKADEDTAAVNGDPSGVTDIFYSAADFRDLVHGLVYGSGRVSSGDFTITPVSSSTVTVGKGLGFIQSSSAAYGSYFIRQLGDTTLTLPAYVSGTEKYRIVAELDDAADNPSSQYPTNYGWHWRVMDNVGTAAADTPDGALSIGVVQKTADTFVGLTNVPFDNVSNTRSLVQVGRSSGWNTVNGSGQPPFLNSWTNYSPSGGLYQNAQFQRSNDGVVTLRGLIAGGASSGAGEAIFVLPVDYRPQYNQVFSVRCQLGGNKNFPLTGTATGVWRLLGTCRLFVIGSSSTVNQGWVIPQIAVSDVQLISGTLASQTTTGINLLPANFNQAADWLSLSGVSFASVGS